MSASAEATKARYGRAVSGVEAATARLNAALDQRERGVAVDLDKVNREFDSAAAEADRLEQELDRAEAAGRARAQPKPTGGGGMSASVRHEPDLYEPGAGPPESTNP